MTDLDTVNPAGWPRPRLPFRGDAIPAPWIARMDWKGENLEPAAIYWERADQVFQKWLCQVCGRPCPSDHAYGPVTIESYRASGELPWGLDGDGYDISGGPVCSERCSRLAIAVCPHFSRDSVSVSVIRFERDGSHDWHTRTRGGRCW